MAHYWLISVKYQRKKIKNKIVVQILIRDQK